MDPTKQQVNQTTKPDISKVNRDVLHVEVRNPDKVVFSGNAVAVSSKNSVGPLDILPQHENFISLVTDKITIYQDKHQKQEIPNTSAIVKNKLNNVNIFLGVESLMGMQNVTQDAQGAPVPGQNTKTTAPQAHAPANLQPPPQGQSLPGGAKNLSKNIKE